jgi:hypothetical protein
MLFAMTRAVLLPTRLFAVAVVGGIALLAGCAARTNVGATGAAPADVEHLWVTVEELWFAQEADTPPEADTGWTRKSLPNPVVIDLANVDPGTLVPLVTNLSVPAGTYRQLHLGLADAADPLLDSARAVGLEYNAQIELREEDGSSRRAPLELPVPRAGLTIPIDLEFKDAGESGGTGASASNITNLAITLDGAQGVIAYEYGANTGYLLSPGASVVDATAAGEIRGRVDTTALPPGHAAIFVSAQQKDAAARHRVVVQRRKVAADGSFSLYPLPAAKKGTTLYDVVITSAGADTVVVRDVPVNAGTEVTTLQSTPIMLTAARTVYADVAPSPVVLPAGTRLEFHQTLPGRDQVPFVIEGTALDPDTRQVPGAAFALASGSLVVGDYAGGNAVSFVVDTPAEGTGGYLVGSTGLYRSTTFAANPAEVSGTSSRPTLLAAPFPQIAAGGGAGRLTVNLLVPSGRYDSGFLTVQAAHGLVETARVDALLRLGGGSLIIDGLPAGSELAPPAGVSYQVSLRAWNSRNAAGTITRIAAPASATLGDAGFGALQLQVQ